MDDYPRRFMIVTVQCLECTDGNAEPEVTASYEGWEDAMQALREMDIAWSSSTDAFIIDTLRGTTLTSHELRDMDRA